VSRSASDTRLIGGTSRIRGENPDHRIFRIHRHLSDSLSDAFGLGLGTTVVTWGDEVVCLGSDGFGVVGLEVGRGSVGSQRETYTTIRQMLLIPGDVEGVRDELEEGRLLL
jgi:hypothetical protein